MRVSKLRMITVATAMSMAVIPFAVQPAASAAPVGLTKQIAINKAAVKQADRICGKWTPRLTEYRKGCRWGALKANGYVPILDLGADGPDANTAEARGFDPFAPPAGDTYAAWGYR